MAKKEKIVDLKSKPEKITKEQLDRVQETVNNINRAQLEIERAQKMATQALEEQKAILTAQAQDAASKIENRIMSEEAYKIITINFCFHNVCRRTNSI